MPRTLNAYTVTLTDGQSFQLLADLSDASAPLLACFFPGEDDRGQITPYQTADAGHSAREAAQLVAEYFTVGPDDCTEVDSVEEAA